MGNFILFVTLLCTLYSLVPVSNGLSCYTCGHVESGDLIGFDLDESCKWGKKPNESFLQPCETEDDNTGDNRFDFVCIQLRISGYLQKGRSLQTNTQRGCAARLNITSTQAQLTECRRGTVSDLLRKFENLVGKEYLQGIKAIYEENSSVKFCSCDDDNTGCSLTDEDIMEDDDIIDTTTTDTTENSDKSSSLNVKITFSLFVILVTGLLMMNV